MRAVSGDPLVELLAEKRLEPVAPVLVGLEIQVQADDRERARIPLGEPVELCGELIHAGHGATGRNADARPYGRLS